MRIVIAGGSGQVGTLLARHFHANRHQVTVLSRRPRMAPWQTAVWDGKSPGDWTQTLSGADVLINLAGRSVNCRYHERNRHAIFDSRVDSTRLLGRLIREVASPPWLWMNASTATIYRHALDRPMDEYTGEFGGGEAGAPDTWRFSIAVARAWEEAFFDSETPLTRKVALRSAMTFSPDRSGVFDVYLGLVRRGLGGAHGSGQQFVSWIHEHDFIGAIEFLIEHRELEGAVNLAAPNPLPNREFLAALRAAWGIDFGLSIPRWALEMGAFVMRTETELILKSRRVVPMRLQEAGFTFRYPEWPGAARELVTRWRLERQRRVAGWSYASYNR